jgi:protein-tyrosine phosphatase
MVAHAALTMGFVDLHAHYLPSLDDGARDRALSMQMVQAVVALGFDRLQATPHQRAGMYLPEQPDIDAAFDWLKQETAAAHPGVQLGLGAENFWDEVMLGRLQHGGLPTYDGGPAFLFEVNPALMPPRIEQNLFELRLGGRLPVMAHPERYVAIQKDPARAEALGRTAALVVDLGALDGAHGRAEMKTARRLLEDGLAHAAATDIHSPDDQRAIAAGMAWIRKRLGPQVLTRLLDEHPRHILAGNLP